MARSKRYQKGGPLKKYGGIESYYTDVSDLIFETNKEVRAEYARLRREANRRLELLQNSEYKNLPSVTSREGGYPALPKGLDETTARKKLYDVARFLNLRTSSIRGARKTTRESLESIRNIEDEDGKKVFDFVNESNIIEFQKFLGAVQKHKSEKGYDSEQYGQLFKYAEEKNIDPKSIADDFEFWMEHEKELKAAPKSDSTIDSAEMARQIGLKID